jgi:acetyltransferase-like isoleucine patch superfamily enzyme
MLGMAYLCATFLLLPFILINLLPLPHYSKFTAISEFLSFFPGYFGILIRRVWYKITLKKCGTNLTVDWLGVIRIQHSEIGNRCTLGVGNWFGWVRVGDDVMCGSYVSIISGNKQHDFSNLSLPMRTQSGEKKQILIDNDVWIGANAIVMADINCGTVIGAGSVVTKTHPPFSIIAGNPASVLRSRIKE